MIIRYDGDGIPREKLLQRVGNTDYVTESQTLRQKPGVSGSIMETVRNVGIELSSTVGSGTTLKASVHKKVCCYTADHRPMLQSYISE